MDVVYDRVTTDIAPSLEEKNGILAYSHRTKWLMYQVQLRNGLQAKKMEWKRGEWYLGAKVITFNAGNGVIKAFDVTSENCMAKPQSYPATSGMLQLQAV